MLKIGLLSVLLGGARGREASRKKWVKNKKLAQNRFLIFITARSSNKKSILNPEYSARRIVWRTLLGSSPPPAALCRTSENTYNLRTLVGIHFYIIIVKLN